MEIPEELNKNKRETSSESGDRNADESHRKNKKNEMELTRN